ncbi:MAG: pyrimidine dimer DNA glycosylase/endonuclease V [Porticoccaceae bacterium]
MNIFVLDTQIDKCARYHCDQHVVKMILESVQLLCTALNKKGFATPYKSTHQNHPCVLWVEESYSNFVWLQKLTIALNKEYQYRYKTGKSHKSMAVLPEIAACRYEDIGLPPFAQAMPEQYKIPGGSGLQGILPWRENALCPLDKAENSPMVKPIR